MKKSNQKALSKDQQEELLQVLKIRFEKNMKRHDDLEWAKHKYRELQKLGGALFCDRRYDTVFLYHNGAESYYAARGFRGLLKV
ncbi:MAG: DUF4256 domain-containing protein [Candidatus Obscuribacterales bacterium]|nr:DUF4256 domain-containing protein [Candidatus Obscuribacterales bacterium]